MSQEIFNDLARSRVLVLDGAMGTSIYRRDLPLSDYDGHDNCVDIVTLTRPAIGAPKSAL